MRPVTPRVLKRLAVGTLAVATAASTAALLPSTAASAAGPAPRATELQITSSGLPAGSIKHVWLIILENKSYDATFTGLNKNSYLWQTLPQQGVLLKDYYGTGHFSQDNYESLVSGQAPQLDTQSDCDVAATNFSGNDKIESTGSLSSNANYGQADSTGLSNPTTNQAKAPGYTPASGNVAYNPDGSNGCVYPSHVPTLFNQLDAAGKTWKGYAQDLGDQPGRDDGACGYPGTAANTPNSDEIGASPLAGPTRLNDAKDYPGVASFTGVQAAGNDANGQPGAKEDGYVAKHFPFPWFHSLLDGDQTTPANGGTDCDANHIANLDSQTEGLVHDLQSESTTPAFSWITPNNCSDAHDAICKGNNLSGSFTSAGQPNYSGVSHLDPRTTTPVNYTGGLYASDLFLKWYVPLIEQSAAFKDGGLIDVTFDEGNPPFVNSSFNNANDPTFAPGGSTSPGVSDPATLSTYLAVDAAGQNVNGVNVNTEPTGPNVPTTVGGTGSACTTTPCPGPGDNGFIDRTPKAAANHTTATATSGSSTILDNSIAATDVGRSVTGTGIPDNSFVGPVSQTGPLFPTSNTGVVTLNQFQLVDANGVAVPVTGAVSGISLGAQSADPTAKNADPIYDATDFTPGGGDTGSVLISPYIKPGTSSLVNYNHYSWLRTMEDLFDVSSGSKTAALTPGAGSISGGLDGLGHLGYAAQVGLTPFGPDVFNNPPTPATPAPVTVPSPQTFPTVSGLLNVGQVVTCQPGTWTGSPTFSYQWLRSGVPIPLATAATYTLTATDFARVVTCRVAATNSAGSVQVLGGGFLPLVGPKLKVTKAESVTGTFKVGKTVKAKAATTTPKVTSTTYQWLRSGKAISGATKSSYKLTAADKGKKVSLKVTLVSVGYTSTTSTSKQTKVS